jgi:hypothetical protein
MLLAPAPQTRCPSRNRGGLPNEDGGGFYENLPLLGGQAILAFARSQIGLLSLLG